MNTSLFNQIIKELSKSDNYIIGVENDLLDIVRKIIIKKHDIDIDDYEEFLKSHKLWKVDLKERNKNIKIDQSWINIDIDFICSIFDECLDFDKRELAGSYYTPSYIIEYMVIDSLKSFLIDKTKIQSKIISEFVRFENIEVLSVKQAKELLQIIKDIKIIDISCGTGLFHLKLFDKLYSLHKAIHNKLNKKLNNYECKKYILSNNLFGIDIDNKSLEILCLAFIDKLADYEDFNIIDLKINVYNENSILDNNIYNIDAIRNTMDKGGFDIVIGNPPYIGEKGNKEKFEEIKRFSFGKKYYEGKMDYFYFFIYRGIELLKNKGILTYITTNYFITADGATKLRKFLKENCVFTTIVNFNECNIFKSAKGQHNIIFSLEKSKNVFKPINIISFNKGNYEENEIKEALTNPISKEEVSSYTLKDQRELYSTSGNILLFTDIRHMDIINKIKKVSNINLGEICNINQGIVSGADKVTKGMLNNKLSTGDIERFNITYNQGIFVLNHEEINKKGFSDCFMLKPFYKNSDIKKYYTKTKSDKYIFYSNDETVKSSRYCKVVYNHLIKFKNILNKRRETANGRRKWYSLQWGRKAEIFEGQKIVVPHRALKNNFGYNEIPWYASADVYYITPKEDFIDLKLLLSILNSKIIYFWLYNMGKRKGNYLELYSRPLSQIPLIIDLKEETKQHITDYTDKILSACKNDYNKELVEKYQRKIDHMLYEIYGFSNDEIIIIEELYNSIRSYR